MDQDSDDQKFFCCVSGRLGDCVNDVGGTKQDVFSLSASQHLVLHTDHWERAHNSHQLPAQRSNQELCGEDGNDDRGGLELENSCLLFRALE